MPYATANLQNNAYLCSTAMKINLHITVFAAIAVVLSLFSGAQNAYGMPDKDKDYVPPATEQPRIIPNYYVKQQRVFLDGDSMTLYTLRTVTVFPAIKFKNKKEEEYYWRTVRNVKILLPYAKMIRETLMETYEYIETFETKKEREDYLKRMEGAIFEQYKPILKRFSRNQAKLLIKLIQRETDQSSYEIVRAFLGSFRAVFWQGFGRLFGVSLKGKYEPSKNREDWMIEQIATRVEQGTL